MERWRNQSMLDRKSLRWDTGSSPYYSHFSATQGCSLRCRHLLCSYKAHGGWKWITRWEKCSQSPKFVQHSTVLRSSEQRRRKAVQVHVFCGYYEVCTQCRVLPKLLDFIDCKTKEKYPVRMVTARKKFTPWLTPKSRYLCRICGASLY